jgi:hypothetical protein
LDSQCARHRRHPRRSPRGGQINMPLPLTDPFTVCLKNVYQSSI